MTNNKYKGFGNIIGRATVKQTFTQDQITNYLLEESIYLDLLLNKQNLSDQDICKIKNCAQSNKYFIYNDKVFSSIDKLALYIETKMERKNLKTHTKLMSIVINIINNLTSHVVFLMNNVENPTLPEELFNRIKDINTELSRSTKLVQEMNNIVQMQAAHTDIVEKTLEDYEQKLNLLKKTASSNCLLDELLFKEFKLMQDKLNEIVEVTNQHKQINDKSRYSHLSKETLLDIRYHSLIDLQELALQRDGQVHLYSNQVETAVKKNIKIPPKVQEDPFLDDQPPQLKLTNEQLVTTLQNSKPLQKTKGRKSSKPSQKKSLSLI